MTKEKTARERLLSKNDMDRLKRAAKYFTPFELLLWAGSVTVIAVFYGVFDGEHPMNLAASLIGATSLIFAAKGNPFAQLLLIVFSVLYGIISWTYAYYGEMITYLGMSAPIAVLALISWLRHPFAGKHSEVRVNHVSMKEHVFLWVLTAGVTAAFYFILKALNTANLIPSTVSVATSFLAAYLTFRRSPLYAVAYAANDIVLIVLWVMATLDTAFSTGLVCAEDRALRTRKLPPTPAKKRGRKPPHSTPQATETPFYHGKTNEKTAVSCKRRDGFCVIDVSLSVREQLVREGGAKLRNIGGDGGAAGDDGGHDGHVLLLFEEGAHEFARHRRPGTVLDDADLPVLIILGFEVADELLHHGEDAAVKSGSPAPL